MNGKGYRLIVLITLLLSSALIMTSCLSLGVTDALTKGQIQQMIDNSMTGNVTVEGGDNFDVTINASSQENVIAAKALLSAVSVRCKFEIIVSGSTFPPIASSIQEQASAGSGVIYKLNKGQGDAYVITNYHVVHHAQSTSTNGIAHTIELYLYGQEDQMYAIPATYVGGSMEYDIAVLKVKGSRVLAESNAAEATFADSDNISVLDQAIAVGNPEDLGLSATLGHVSVDSEYITMNASDGLSVVQQRVIRIDTPINSGNSGGGLFNSSGEVIGIVNAKLMSSENMGYALPSSFVKYVAENIIYYCDGTQYENVYRCYLGIEVRASKMYTVYDLDTGKVLKREEVSVSKLTDGGLAIGKLQVGDVINSITIDGVKYDTVRLHSVTDPMLNARVGSVVVVNVTRDGVVMDVAITISNASLTMIK